LGLVKIGWKRRAVCNVVGADTFGASRKEARWKEEARSGSLHTHARDQRGLRARPRLRAPPLLGQPLWALMHSEDHVTLKQAMTTAILAPGRNAVSAPLPCRLAATTEGIYVRVQAK